MEYILTQHAQDALRKRAIPIEWVERALAASDAVEADQVDPDLEHRLIRIPEAGNRVLRVIVNRKTRPMRVGTVFFDRRVIL